MSQDAQETYPSGRSSLSMREEDIANAIKGERELLDAVGKLASNSPEEVAQGLKALGDIQERIAGELGKPWSQEQKVEWVNRFADFVTHAKGGEDFVAAISGTPAPAAFESRTGVVVWTPAQRQGFMDTLSREGLIPPVAPSTPPTPGVLPPAAGK